LSIGLKTGWGCRWILKGSAGEKKAKIPEGALLIFFNPLN
jgi:hypothetical protein